MTDSPSPPAFSHISFSRFRSKRLVPYFAFSDFDPVKA